MSILLESLSQQSSSQDNSVPDIHVSHFDDEMLGDDWLLKRIKLWQGICAALVILLILSWVYFYSQLVSSEKIIAATPADISTDLNASTHFQNMTPAVENQPILSNQKSVENQADLQSNPHKETLPADTGVKQVYVPKKRELINEVTSKEKTPATDNLVSENSNQQKDKPYQGAILSLEELSDELQSQFPHIEINSYVVADTPADSFVILDGSFYQVNQVIAPDLILRQITQAYIVVEFHNQRVKLPLN